MIAKPAPNQNPLDPKLALLADPELGERLRSHHPELFTPAEVAPPSASVEQTEPGSELGRALAIVGMLLALLASYALGSIMRAHWNNDVPPLVSLAPPAPARHASRILSDHRNLSPAAARAVLAVRTKSGHSQLRVARIIAQSSRTPEHRAVALLTVRAKPHAAQRAAFREQIKIAHATPIAASLAAQTTPVASADQAASSDDDTSAGDDVSGRQMASGPVWTENGPGSLTPGGIVLGRGSSGGGGGMPGGCPRGR